MSEIVETDCLAALLIFQEAFTCLTRNTRPSNTSQDSDWDEKFPTLQFFLLGEPQSQYYVSKGRYFTELFTDSLCWCLAICRITEPLALTSVVPYAYDLMRVLIKGDKTNAAFYVGLFFASFSITESLTGLFWGALSDRVGRKPILLLASGGMIVSVLVVGLAPNVLVEPSMEMLVLSRLWSLNW